MNEAQTRLNLIDPAIRVAGARNQNSEEDPSAHGSDILAHGTRALRRIGFLVVFFLGSGMVAVAAWTKETKKTEYTFDGLREDYVITESSDYGIVTNSISRHDFLGRKIFEWTPRGTTTNVYDGATPRVLTSTFTSGGVSQTTTYLYNLLAQPVGTVINGITNRTDVTYEEISNQVWHVTTTSVIGPHTNSVSFFKKQLTGLVNGLRGRTVRMGADGVTTTSERTFNDETNIETEKENRSTGEWSITHRMYGLVLDVQTAEGTTFNAYDAFGRVAGVYFARPNGPTNPVSRTTYTPAGDVASVEQFTNGVLAARETYEYNALGQRTSVTNALGHSTHTSYDPFGNVLSEDGATYPTRYSYDTSGRRTAMWTTRDGSSWDETRWTYDPRTGFCTSKVYADGSVVRYDHASDGLLTRTTYPSGRWKENVYGQNRELCGVRYSMASMDYDLFLDSFGMATNVANAAGDTWSYFYGINSTLTNESWQVDGCHCYPYRFYSPVLCCWLTRDPLGEEVGGNLYLFVKNNFIAYFDGLGLKICVIKHLPGSAPTAGWGGRGRNNAETHYKVPTVSYQKMTYTNGKVRYRVVITPSISFVDVYFRNLQAYTFLWSDEQEHVALIRHCDAAIESFKTKAESIYDCVKPAEKKLSEYLNDLDRAIEEYEQKTLELDKPGGKHGH